MTPQRSPLEYFTPPPPAPRGWTPAQIAALCFAIVLIGCVVVGALAQFSWVWRR
jgi:hypothetical protein